VVVPIVLGIVIGLALLSAPELARSLLLIAVNALWLVFRDAVWSPGRAMIKTKVISLTGAKVTWLQALIRNTFLIVPFALVPGYICEIARLLLNTSLLWRRIVYGICVVGALAVLPAAITGGALSIIGTVLALATAVLFLISDKEAIASGRLADLWAKTQVVEA